jgi:hypothetical protein
MKGSDFLIGDYNQFVGKAKKEGAHGSFIARYSYESYLKIFSLSVFSFVIVFRRVGPFIPGTPQVSPRYTWGGACPYF